MQPVHIDALAELSLEFKSIRESGIRRFPESIWIKTITITKTIPISEVSRAINIPVSYLRKKVKELAMTATPMKFVEAIQEPQRYSNIIINIDSAKGQKMKIEGVTTDSLLLLVSEFLKKGSSCSR